MTQSIRVGVIGCGAIAQEHFHALATVPQIRLVGVCDLSPASARYAAERFGSDKHFADHRQMLDESRCDVVHVLTHPNSHASIVADVLSSGAHVVCEKPLTPTLAQTKDLLSLATTSGRILIECQHLRFDPYVTKLHGFVAEGTLGELVTVEAVYSLPLSGGKFDDPHNNEAVMGFAAGPIQDFLPHLVYTALGCLGDPPAIAVKSEWRNISGNERLVFDEMSASVTFPTATAFVRFSANSAPPALRIRLTGSNGYAETDLFNPFVRLETAAGRSKLSPILNQVRNGSHFAKSAATNLASKVTGRPGYAGLALMLQSVYSNLNAGLPQVIGDRQILSCATVVDEIVNGAQR